MRHRTDSTKINRLTLAAATTAAIFLASGACTLLVDKNSAQCAVDSDCARFGGHPYCQSGVCVSSGLSPADCFYGTPQQPSDFLNQCSTAECLSFDNCQKLGLCGSADDMDAALVPPPLVDGGTEGGGGDGGRGDGGGGTGSGDGGGGGGGGDGGSGPLPSCLDPSNGRSAIIVMTGSSNFPPLLSNLAPLIIATGYTPVYQVTSSCAGVASILGNTNTATDPAPGSTGKYAQYYQQDGSSVSCSLGPNGAPVDIGESDTFASGCPGFGEPGPGTAQYFGPIQAMVFIVPGASQQQTISAQAAREVFGTGQAGDGGLPWTNPNLYFVRNGNTGTQQMIGKAINVPPSQFWGIDRGSAANLDEEMRVITDPTTANQAVGFISADYYDADRSNLNALAFEADGQECAYLPDSTPFKKDKQNVRDGHYPIWGPLHFFAAVSNGVPVSAGAAAFVSVVSVPNLPQAFLHACIASSLVPTCAMQVQRSSELGPLSVYAPPFGCGCYFEASTNGSASSACTPCMTANDCTNPARPACNLGYCEVQ